MSMTSTIRMGTPFFHEFKKQASFFLREKIKHARLALTDVTSAELLTEEATSGNPWAPDAKTLGFISRAAFDIDNFWRIVEILHKRLAKFDKKQWREPYNALVLLEHLLTHGPGSIADEIQCDGEVIQKLGSFQHIDERGFDWGLAARKKSERVLKLLEKGPALKEERDRARKITRGIQGFGSLNYRWSYVCKDGIQHSCDYFGRRNSHYETCGQQDDEILENLNQSCNTDAERVGGEEEEANLHDERQSKGLMLAAKKFQKEEHPFSYNEHQRMESMLFLSQS